MQFVPLSDEELYAKPVVGLCDYEIVYAEETTSNSGNPMMKLKVKTWNHEGGEYLVHDNLVFVKSCMWKVSQFSKASGLYEQYKNGNMDQSDVLGKTGKCVTMLEKSDHDGREYVKIKNYVEPEEGNTAKAADATKAAKDNSEAPNIVDDDLPF
jgi:hypothetical protein